MRRLLLGCSFAVVLAGCGADVVDVEVDPTDADIAAPEPEAFVAGTIRIAQLNPYYAGRLEPVGISRPSCTRTTDCSSACTTKAQEDCFECIDKKCRKRSFETAETAADLFAAIHADVVGIEELDPVFAPKIDRILEAATGESWEYKVSPQGIGGVGSGVGVYWRTARVSLAADLGPIDVGTLASGYKVRYQGVLLQTTAGKTFGVFAGKLDWNSGEGAIRETEARALRKAIDMRMAPYGNRPRVVASDFNDTVGSAAYDVFADYDDGGARKATSASGQDPSRRIDYLFWGDGPGGASSPGFVGARSDGRLGRSMFFGSDHRFVYGDARVN